MGTKHIAVADAGPLTRDVMLADPETLPATATVAEARALFESPRQKLVVVTSDSHFVGAVSRTSIEGADDAAALDACVDRDVPVLGPEDPTERVYEIVDQTGLTRIPVVDGAGELVGLVCFNGPRDAFCVA